MSLRLDKFLLILFSIGLAIRIVYVFTLSPEIRFDEVDFDNLASNIIKGVGYINTERDILKNHLAARPPAYPVFLAAIYRVFGHSIAAARVAQALISGLLIIVIYYIAKEVFGLAAARLAAFFASFYPFFTYYSGVLQSELLCAFWLALAVLFTSRLLERSGWENIVLSGVFIALIGLTRPVFLLYALFLVIAFISFKKFSYFKAIKLWLLVLAVVSIVFLPWVIRNYLVLGAFIPGTTESGQALYVANHPTADGSPGPNIYDKELAAIRSQITNEIAVDKYFRQKALGFIINNPRHYIWLISKRFIKIWNIFPETAPLDKVLSFLSFGVLLPFFLIGIVRALRLNNAGVLITTIFYVSLVFPIMFYGSTRMRFPIDSFVLIFSASGIVFLFSRFGYEIDERMLKLYRGKGIDTLFFLYRWKIFPHKLVESYVPKVGLIYDLGCGHGIFSNYLVMQSPLRRVIGVEYDQRRLNVVQETVKGRDNPVFLLSDIGMTGYDECAAFILLDVLHHCPSYEFQKDLVNRCYENLRHGGRLIIAEVNNRPHHKYALCWFLDHLMSPFHGIYYRSEKKMRRLLEDVGFQVEVKAIDSRIPYTSILFIADKR